MLFCWVNVKDARELRDVVKAAVLSTNYVCDILIMLVLMLSSGLADLNHGDFSQ